MIRRVLLLTITLSAGHAVAQNVVPAHSGGMDGAGTPPENPPRAGIATTESSTRGSCLTPVVVASGSRFLNITPRPPGATVPVALFVSSPRFPFLCAYVNAAGKLTTTPVFRTPLEWGTVHLTDEDIIPETPYSVQADCGVGTLSASAFDTTWLWGDVNDDGIVELGDVLCELDGYRADFSRCPFQALNLAPFDDRIDLSDILAVLDAYYGLGYLGPTPTPDPLTVDSVPAITATLSVTLAGHAPTAESVKIVGELGTVTTAVSMCRWSAKVALGANHLNRLVITARFGDGTSSAPVFVDITQDMLAPTVFIDFPADASQVTSDVTGVAGRVSDVLSGFTGLTVTVNGQPATVNIGVGTNGTFFLPQVALTLGTNTLTAVATDGVGNSVQHQIAVIRTDIPKNSATLQAISGDAQGAAIHQVLSQPMVVRVTGAMGEPLEGKVVNFKVTRSDGRLAAKAPPFFGFGNMLFQAISDADGQARAFWRLGSDAGSGNNRVEVTSSDVFGTTIFCASATHGPAAQINIGTGNNQRAAVGGPPPEPLRIWVNDSCNPVPNVPVTFTVILGGGSVNGQPAATVNTSPTGHAEIDFITGSQAGLNLIEVDFASNPTTPARFLIYGVEPDPAQPTLFSGIVLNNANEPLQGAMCMLIVGQTQRMTQSDIDGRFEFNDIPEDGPADFLVSGSTVFRRGGAGGMNVPPGTYPFLHYELQIIAHAENSLGMPVLLPPLNPNNARIFDNTQDMELTVEGIAGLKMLIKAGSMMLADGRIPSPSSPARVSLNQVHFDDVPMPMTDGAAPPFAWTLQPGGARFDPPIAITYPNMSGLPAGALTNFLSFNHDTGRFEIAASGRVSDDGQFIVSDPGSGIAVAGWGCNCPPYSVTGECCHCNQCQQCMGGACVSTGTPCGKACCSNGQLCCDGTCIPADTICCEGGSSCPADETCCHGSCCLEGEECCENGCCQADQQCCLGKCVNAFFCCDTGIQCFPEFPLCCGQGCCVADGVCCNDDCQIPGSSCCDDGHVCSPPTAECCGAGCCNSDECQFCDGGTCQNACGPNQVCCAGACCADCQACVDGKCEDFCTAAECKQCANGGGDAFGCESTCGPNQVCCAGACCADCQACVDGQCEDLCDADQCQQCADGACAGCGAGHVCCSGECLPANQCCSDGRPFCGDVCCNAGAVCCEGTCTPESQCCSDGRPFCGQICCFADHVCCNGTCTPESQCCSDGRPFCGQICCLADHVCCSGQCRPANPGCGP